VAHTSDLTPFRSLLSERKPVIADIDVVMLPLCPSKLDALDEDEVETQPGSGLSIDTDCSFGESPFGEGPFAEGPFAEGPFAEGESFEGFDEDTFNNFDFFNASPALASSSGFELESIQQLKEVRAIETETPDECEDLIPAEEADAMLDPEIVERPGGCPLDPCRIMVSINKLTIRTQRWASLPSIPENVPLFVPTTGARTTRSWWKRCFGTDDAEDGSDVSSDVSSDFGQAQPCGFRRTVSTRNLGA
jgi:hypothetical protein